MLGFLMTFLAVAAVIIAVLAAIFGFRRLSRLK